jgi:coiled-coil domain-containing protein 130
MQGFNMGRYYPPDASSAPSFNKSHPLGARANKISQGILTVRFELPFAVWCQHCKPEGIVGQGVRFNAAKEKVGNYYSTPIWSFKMKHTACGGEWEIRTDPKTTQYVCVQGCRKRDYGPEEGQQDGELRFLSEAEKERRREDAFAGLEGKLEDKARDKDHKERVEELYEKAEVWRDPYDVNAKLRKDMREKRRVWKKEEKHREGMQDKFSLHLDILDETEADRQRAGLIDFGGVKDDTQIWKPLFVESHTEDTD